MSKNNSIIPEADQIVLAKKVNDFNAKKLVKSTNKYSIILQGKFIYLERKDDDGMITKIGRLTYNGSIKDMDFAVFKYSSEKYDPNEFGFPGTKYLNGTIEGSMKAGLEIY